MKPKVALIVLNWNGVDDTVQLLDSFKKVKYPNFDLVVVDNASEGQDVHILEERYGDGVHIVKNDRNYGYAEGMNRGMRYAMEHLNPRYIMTFNNDTLVEPDFLNELVGVAEEKPDVGFLGVKLRITGTDIVGPNCGWLNWWTGNGVDGHLDDSVREVEIVTGCAQFMSRRVLEKVGLYDPSYSASFDNIEMCLRGRKAGYKTFYVPSSIIWHKGKRSRSKLFAEPRYFKVVRKNVIHGMKDRIRLLRRYSPPIRRPFQFILLFTYVYPSLTIHAIMDPKNPVTLRNILAIFLYYPIKERVVALLSRVGW